MSRFNNLSCSGLRYWLGQRNVFLRVCARGWLREVRADNPGARHLYDSLGFVELGVRPGYYKPDNVDAVVMRLAIPVPQAGLASTDTASEQQENPS